MLNPISATVNELRTDPLQDVGLACTTSLAETSCDITLTNKNAYEPVAPNWTVMETLPTSLDRTNSSVLSNNLQTVTVSGLSNSTSYTFTVDYFKVNADIASATSLNSILKRFNFLLVIGLMIILVVGTSLSFNYYSKNA